jgi:hypothetical protein
MSEIFPNSYAVLFIAQIVALMVIYIILRLKGKLKVMNSVCLTVLIVAALTLLLLCFDLRSIGPVSRADVLEYITGTFVVAAPFMLILIGRFLAPLLAEIASNRKDGDPERARILRMVEDRKITAEEGSDLLEAMGKSNALRGQDKFSRLDMAVLGGVALVVMGFFLPWVHIRISEIPRMRGILNVFDQSSAYQAGYHTGPLGWTIFAIAIMSIVPVFVTPKGLLYKISIFHLFLVLVGLLLALITLLRAGNHLGMGIIACTVGFTIELIASGAKFKRLAT